jgi:hypothetical protein
MSNGSFTALCEGPSICGTGSSEFRISNFGFCRFHEELESLARPIQSKPGKCRWSFDPDLKQTLLAIRFSPKHVCPFIIGPGRCRS